MALSKFCVGCGAEHEKRGYFCTPECHKAFRARRELVYRSPVGENTMTPDRCEYCCSCALCISLELHCDDCNDRQYDDSIERLSDS
jgi:hypothetical protein